MSLIKKTVKFVLIFFVIMMFTTTVGATNKSISWYCKRTKDHSLPPLADELKFVEDYNTFWCDKNVASNDKVIYLTFDAGYENGNVKRIVDILKEENITGAFFILDNLIYSNEELVKEMISNGNTVANHTAKHKNITLFNEKNELYEEISRLEKLYENKYGQSMPKYFRPPEGKFNEKALKWLDELGYKTVMWSFAYEDWSNNKQLSNEVAKKKILDNVHNGEVMLLHPTSKTNAEILKDVIKELKAQGYRFGSLDELCNK